MTAFGLIHGSWTTPWHWHPLVGELEARGHAATAVELPIEDPSAALSDYAAAAAEQLAGAPDDLVVVASSMGGMSAPLLAELRPVGAVVFVNALLPLPGRTLAEQLRSEPVIVPGRIEAATRREDRSIVSTGDRIVDPQWSRRAAPDRLGVGAEELEGGHCPMLARPADLADLLERP